MKKKCNQKQLSCWIEIFCIFTKINFFQSTFYTFLFIIIYFVFLLTYKNIVPGTMFYNKIKDSWLVHSLQQAKKSNVTRHLISTNSEIHLNTGTHTFGISQTQCRYFKTIPKSVPNIKYRIHLPIIFLCPVDVAEEKV